MTTYTRKQLENIAKANGKDSLRPIGKSLVGQGNEFLFDCVVSARALIEMILLNQEEAAKYAECHDRDINELAEADKSVKTNGLSHADYWNVRGALGMTPRDAAEFAARKAGTDANYRGVDIEIGKLIWHFDSTDQSDEAQGWRLVGQWWNKVTPRIQRSILKAAAK